MDEGRTQAAWTCSQCSETVDGRFAVCWNCGSTSDGTTDPEFQPELGEEAEEQTATQAGPVAMSSGRLVIGCFVFLSLFLVLSVTRMHYAAGNDVQPYVERALFFLECIGLVFGIAFGAGIIVSLAAGKKKMQSETSVATGQQPVRRTQICPNCLTPNEPIQHFCVRCRTPLTSHAAIDPLGQVYSAGDTYRKAAARPAKLTSLIGMWLIFGPQIPFLILSLCSTLKSLFAFEDSHYYHPVVIPSCTGPERGVLVLILRLPVILGWLVLCLAILRKVTKNYCRDEAKDK